MNSGIEILPVVLAFIAALMCARAYPLTRCTNRRVVLLMSIINASMLIVAQSSWWVTKMAGDIDGRFWANIVWTVFNALSMTTLMVNALATGERHR